MCFLYISSTESNTSSFCQQEIGMAKGLDKKILSVIVDTEPPQSFIAHKQALKCKNFENIYDSLFEYLPKNKEVEKHLEILKCKGFSKEKKT